MNKRSECEQLMAGEGTNRTSTITRIHFETDNSQRIVWGQCSNFTNSHKNLKKLNTKVTKKAPTTNGVIVEFKKVLIMVVEKSQAKFVWANIAQNRTFIDVLERWKGSLEPIYQVMMKGAKDPASITDEEAEKLLFNLVSCATSFSYMCNVLKDGKEMFEAFRECMNRSPKTKACKKVFQDMRQDFQTYMEKERAELGIT